MGGDAAFDIGMSHPDLFAGVIPINGLCDGVCKWYTQNAGHTQWFVVSGEYDGRETFTANASTLARMIREKTDVVLVEFVQRGYESYPRGGLSDLRLDGSLPPPKATPREFRMSVFPSESRFYWLQADGLPQSSSEPTFMAGPAKGVVKPMVLRKDYPRQHDLSHVGWKEQLRLAVSGPRQFFAARADHAARNSKVPRHGASVARGNPR